MHLEQAGLELPELVLFCLFYFTCLFKTGSHYAELAGLEFPMQIRMASNRDSPASASGMLGFQACTTMPK